MLEPISRSSEEDGDSRELDECGRTFSQTRRDIHIESAVVIEAGGPTRLAPSARDHRRIFRSL